MFPEVEPGLLRFVFEPAPDLVAPKFSLWIGRVLYAFRAKVVWTNRERNPGAAIRDPESHRVDLGNFVFGRFLSD